MMSYFEITAKDGLAGPFCFQTEALPREGLATQANCHILCLLASEQAQGGLL